MEKELGQKVAIKKIKEVLKTAIGDVFQAEMMEE